ncbi:MAG: hypothetical protein IJ881_07370 [Neisseriaceae bacterium]|nr:hypothetical protein [Neisseriaceae bacterium]MBR3425318.1 hypothetical protein [Neisseriaceae bacterium]
MEQFDLIVFLFFVITVFFLLINILIKFFTVSKKIKEYQEYYDNGVKLFGSLFESRAELHRESTFKKSFYSAMCVAFLLLVTSLIFNFIPFNKQYSIIYNIISLITVILYVSYYFLFGDIDKLELDS